ncbi:MAG: DeoR/GlpR family DNA-binding transcription regulator [Liquorilactobacillus ghanensis]|uniref:DeoR/GlpR family DNA-binding transcription regulator n=1 Tax=Liquorilactobacillus ghanensis TaxID=399370 RepID=UPI0039ED6126
MFKNERLNKIIEILQRKKVISIADLRNKIFVSDSTIRRDIIALENMGKVKRRYGNVELIKPENVELSYLFREQEHEKEKKYIANIASNFLGDNQAIFIDSSSTASFLAGYFSNLHNVIVVTNGLRLAVELDNLPNIKTFISGGRVRAGSGSILGDITLNFLENFRANLNFISCAGIDTSGIYMSSEEQSSVKRQMLSLSDKSILLCDYSKFGKKGYYRLCSPRSVNTIITNSKPSEEIVNCFSKNGIEILF